ncbi:putative transcriptional regulator, TetR family [Chondromyces apiculatus DSM 436]|uniref:Putative transcriptional regulator, TetR family n=2 Tax=Chondromyces apiculatus TaxID=51 RepID=A0A017T4T1_9BACT|nr:putative transcriptional regulator, TetR family [Chondromyces apiculatus DSM 436]
MPRMHGTLAAMSSAEKRIQDAAMRLFAERGVTQVTVSELAEAAGVARGTIYNRKSDVGTLFEQLATRLTEEMTTRIDATMAGIDDPARRIATGIRLFVRRAHEEPPWGRFVARFGATAPTMRALLAAGPSRDLEQGVRGRRLVLRREQIAAALAMMSASVLGAIVSVVDGHQTWREAGSTTAELFLRALGVPLDEARALSKEELPPLEAETQ